MSADSSEYHRPWCLCPNGHWWLGWPKVVNVCTECSLGAASEHAYPSGLVAALDGAEPPAPTATFTYTVTTFADPFLVCEECGRPVSGYYNAPGHDLDRSNVPCRHLGVQSTCMSWGPVDGCRCEPPCASPEGTPS